VACTGCSKSAVEDLLGRSPRSAKHPNTAKVAICRSRITSLLNAKVAGMTIAARTDRRRRRGELAHSRRGRSGTTHNEAEWKRHRLAGRRCTVQFRQEDSGGLSTHLVVRYVDRGERRLHFVGEWHVVEPHDRNILGTP
jgi:hypothetical protein